MPRRSSLSSLASVVSRALVMPAALLGLGLVACGGETEEPLLGVWQVTSHTHHAAGCDGPGAPATEPPYIQFQVSDVAGQDVLELVDCSSPTACEVSQGLQGRLYTEAVPGGFRAQVFVAAGDSAACALGARRSDALVAADGTLRVETRSYELRDVSGVVCEGGTARRMFGSLPCLDLDIVVATHLP